MHEGILTPYIIKKDEENSDNDDAKKKIVSQGEFVAVRSDILGIVIPLEFKKSQKKGFELTLVLSEGRCDKKRGIVAKANSKIKNVKSGRKNAKVNFKFEKYLENAKDKEFCFEVDSNDLIGDNFSVDYFGADILYGFKSENK